MERNKVNRMQEKCKRKERDKTKNRDRKTIKKSTRKI